MIKETYREMNEQIHPEPGLVYSILNTASEKRSGSRRKYRRTAVVLALALCLMAATPVLAGSVPAVHRALYAVSPALAQALVPVRESCEENGIRMEVEAAKIEGDTAQVLVSLRDLTESRIDGTTDLFDSYRLFCPFDSTGTCRQTSWDPETGTVRFEITIRTMHGEAIPGGKVTFAVGCFLSGIREEEISIPLDLTALPDRPDTTREWMTGWGGSEEYEEETGFLARRMERELVPGIRLTAAGILDGRLHIQICSGNNTLTDNHGFLYLVGPDGSRTDCVTAGHFAENMDTEERKDYTEYVFELPDSGLAGYTLGGHFWTGGERADGPWQVTFDLERETD